MDKETLIKELCNEDSMKKLFMNRVRRLATYNKAQAAATQTGESPEFRKSMEGVNKLAAQLNIDPNIAKLILDLNLAVLHTMAENNQRLLSLMYDHPE